LSALPYLSSIYLTIVIWLFIRHAGYFLHLSRLRNSEIYKIQPRLKLFADTIAARIGIRKKVTIWLSGLVDSPVTIGFFKPIILVPLAMVNHLTTDQVEAILLHELAHIRRNDYLINLFISWAGIALFFNPFARSLIRSIRKEREHCCDDLVLQFQYEPHSYASALLSLEKSRKHLSSLVLPATGRSRQLLLERVLRMTGQSSGKRRIGFGGIAAFLICMGFGQFMIWNPSPAMPVQKISQSVRIGSPSENQQAEFVVQQVPIKKKSTQRPVQYARIETRLKQKTKVPGNGILWVSADLEDAPPADQEIVAVPALQTELRAFSIESTPAPSSAPLGMGENSFPYVPSTSFNYHVQVDTSRPGKYYYLRPNPEAEQAMENAILALNKINWKEIEKEYAKQGQKLNVEALRKQLSKSLAGLDWNKMDQDLHLRLNRGDEIRISSQIRKELNVLYKLNVKDKEKIRKIQNNIRRGQLMLEKENLEKELELIDKQESQPHQRTIVDI
ncbi:MAG: M56 family metallopeptidase, partial [Chitinophagales bacterium]